MLTGPDVSHWQGAVNWSAVRNAGHTFAFCKATEGTGFVDDRFGSNWGGIAGAGMVRGAYHFLRSESDGAAQARHFLNVVGDLSGSLAALDVERSGAGTNPTMTHVRNFAAEFARLTGGHPLVIYTGRWYWVGVLGDPYGADLGPLWHARYDSTPGPMYGGWGLWTFWQHTSTGSCPGISGGCDLNQFAYDVPQLLWLTGQAPPSQEEDDLPYSEPELRRIIRSVLDEGTAYGQISWAGTSKATLSTIQHTYNQVVALRREINTMVDKILDQLPATNIQRADVELAVRTVMQEMQGDPT